MMVNDVHTASRALIVVGEASMCKTALLREYPARREGLRCGR
jgi:hypothetical protein